MAVLPIKIKGRHIKGHQDDHKDYTKLTHWEQLNVQVDRAAKRCLAAAKRLPPPGNSAFASEALVVYFRGEKLSRIDKKELYQEIFGPTTKAKWVDLHKIPADLVDNIAWKAVQ